MSEFLPQFLRFTIDINPNEKNKAVATTVIKTWDTGLVKLNYNSDNVLVSIVIQDKEPVKVFKETMTEQSVQFSEEGQLQAFLNTRLDLYQNQPCQCCSKPIQNYSGNPAEWGTAIPYHNAELRRTMHRIVHYKCINEYLDSGKKILTPESKHYKSKTTTKIGGWTVTSYELNEKTRKALTVPDGAFTNLGVSKRYKQPWWKRWFNLGRRN